jgi:hypothetical protein
VSRSVHDFEHGVVLHDVGTTSQAIPFEELLRLLGQAGPEVNTGQVAGSLTLSAATGGY